MKRSIPRSVAQAFLPVFGRSPKVFVRAYTPDTGRNACATAVIALALAATAAVAQTMPATTRATTRPRGDLRTFTVSPMAVPAASLKYPLRVPAADQIDGNAAPLYLEAFAEIAGNAKINAIIDADDLDDDNAFMKVVNANQPFDASIPPLIATATLRGQCDWSTPIRAENLRASVPHLNGARAMSHVLYAKCRIALIHNDVEQALRLTRAMSVLADQLDAGDVFLVNSLVSIGIQAFCNDQIIEQLIQRSDAPNLYWSLRQYRVPFGNLRGSMEAEQQMVLAAFPPLRKVRDGEPITADDWQRYIDEQTTFQRSLVTPPTEYKPQMDLAAGLTAMMVNGLAKPYYAKTRHLSDADVAKLDPRLLVAVYTFETYQQMSDSIYQWYSLPYPEMLPGLQRATAAIVAQPAVLRTNPFAITASSYGRVGVNSARLDRTIAAITVVESLRAYAAGHDGALPPTLDAIVDTPAPMNPVTGKPFDYSVNGDVATIGDDGKLVDWPLRYEVHLRR